MKNLTAVAFGLSCLLLASDPLFAQSSGTTQHRTRTVCENVTVQDQPKDSNQIAGMAIGGVAGGLLGHQVGGGKGKTLATVAGAVGGGYAGKKIQENQQAKHTHVERRCREVAY